MGAPTNGLTVGHIQVFVRTASREDLHSIFNMVRAEYRLRETETFEPGDEVEFTSRKEVHYGVVLKLNSKSVRVRERGRESDRHWNVAAKSLKRRDK
jgi:hypothetical protein